MIAALLAGLAASHVDGALVEPGSSAYPVVLRISVLGESASVLAMARAYEQAESGVLVQAVTTATRHPVDGTWQTDQC